MQRVTITLDEELAAEIDRLVKARGYQGRSEAIRDLAREGLRQIAAEDPERTGDCLAALVYVYDHESRALAERLTHTFHEHHDLSVSALHVHLDHDMCLEVNVLRGPIGDVRHLGSHVIAERGVQFGRMVLMPAEMQAETHAHGPGHAHGHLHTHVKPGAAEPAVRAAGDE